MLWRQENIVISVWDSYKTSDIYWNSFYLINIQFVLTIFSRNNQEQITVKRHTSYLCNYRNSDWYILKNHICFNTPQNLQFVIITGQFMYKVCLELLLTLPVLYRSTWTDVQQTLLKCNSSNEQVQSLLFYGYIVCAPYCIVHCRAGLTLPASSFCRYHKWQNRVLTILLVLTVTGTRGKKNPSHAIEKV